MPGSRRYADPASYLMTPEQWETQRSAFCRLVGKAPSASEGLAQAEAELHASLIELERLLASGTGPVRLGKDGELVIPQLSAEETPARRRR